MDLHKKLCFSGSIDLSSIDQVKRIPKYLRDEDGGLGDLNPEWIELEKRDRERDDELFAELFADLDALPDYEPTEEPTSDKRPTPAPHPPTVTVSAVTPEEWAEIDAVFSEIGIMPTVPDSPAGQHNQEQPEVIPSPALPVQEPVSNGFRECAGQEPKAAPDTHQSEPETDFALLSTDTLLSLQKSRFSGEFVYSDTERSLNRNIALELTERGISPIKRNFPKYDGVACKSPAISAYMLDLQTFDLLWIWHTQNGHQTDKTANGGLFDDVFSGNQFDFEKAHKIAVGRYETKTGKTKYLTAGRKAKCLRLPECWQEQLAVLHSDAIRQRQDEAKNKARREQEKLDGLKVRAIDIRHKLETYRGSTPHACLNIDVYTNVWLALELTNGSRTYLVDATRKYNELTGESITKSLMQGRLDRLKKALK